MSEDDVTVEALRADTTGVEKVIHFNNAGCSLPPSPVLRAQVDYLVRESETGGYETADQVRDEAEHAYSGLARLLGVKQDEVGFCGNATDAWRRVLYALPLGRGARIAFDESIYGGNLLALIEGRERFQWQLQSVRLDDSGAIDLAALEEVLRTGVDLVAATHMAAQSGAVNPIAEISELSRRYGAWCLVDACQTIGHVPIDLAATQVDGFIFTGRKYLRAPRGTGGFIVRRPLLDRILPLGPDIRGGAVEEDGGLRLSRDASVLEQWERNWALHLGLGAAIDYLLALDRSWTWGRIRELAATLSIALSEVPGVLVHRRSGESGGIVLFDVVGKDLVKARDWLRARGANVMFAGPQNAPLEMFRTGDPGRLRASIHYYNTDEEIRRFADLVAECGRSL